MDKLYSFREWIWECDRFLFLAEVHHHNKSVVPGNFRFEHDLGGQVLESLLAVTKAQCERDAYCISFDRCLSMEESSMLVRTLDAVKCGNWKEIGIEDIVRSQEILHKLAKALDDDIMKAYESKGFPSLYKACGIQ